MIQTIHRHIGHTLPAASLQEFLTKAGHLHHDASRLLDGEEITNFFTMHSFDEGRTIICNASGEERALRLQTFFNESLVARSRLGQGKHDRGEAVVFAGAPVTHEDAKGINRHFPVHVKGISVLHKTIREGETWDVSVRGADFGFDEMEEVYTMLNVGTLVIEKGGRLVVRGNVFSFLCQQLVCADAETYKDFQVGILPTPFSVDFGHGPHHGAHGENGLNGLDGAHGIAPIVSSGILGPWIPEYNDAKRHGTHGSDGAHATDGAKGRNGGFCKLAELTIRKLQGRLCVFSQAGEGGNGGNGGHGGHGGQGGNGSAGVKGFNETVPDGRNGDGGHGGNGGRGGNAGHGGISSNIYLRVPADAVAHVRMVSLPSGGGIGGQGGNGGTGGQAGQVNGNSGTPGTHGQTGKPGQNGRSRPGAYLYLNDRPYTSPIS